MTEEDDKSPLDKLTLLEAIPPTPLPDAAPAFDRDLSLGRFMDAWSQLEANIRALLSALSAAPPETSFSIAAAIPDVGRMYDLLMALGATQLETPEDMKELEEICDHFRISSKFRNSIVHGQWLLTNNRMPPPFGSYPPYMWVRVYTIIDKMKEFNAVVGADEKTAQQHVFTIEHLNQRAQSARILGARVSRFSESIKTRVRFPERGT